MTVYSQAGNLSPSLSSPLSLGIISFLSLLPVVMIIIITISFLLSLCLSQSELSRRCLDCTVSTLFSPHPSSPQTGVSLHHLILSYSVNTWTSIQSENSPVFKKNIPGAALVEACCFRHRWDNDWITPQLHVEKKLLATPCVMEVCTSQVKTIVRHFWKYACSLSGGQLDENIDSVLMYVR